MRTVDEIFNWLTRNSFYFVDMKSKDDIAKMISDKDSISLFVAVNYVPAFHADYEEFEIFLGEPFSFVKHMMPLVDAGLISCVGVPLAGVVKNYDTNKVYVRYWLGKTNPNELW